MNERIANPGPKSERSDIPEPDDNRQLLFFHGRLVLEHQGFKSEEIQHLVFIKWLYMRGSWTAEEVNKRSIDIIS